MSSSFTNPAALSKVFQRLFSVRCTCQWLLKMPHMTLPYVILSIILALLWLTIYRVLSLRVQPTNPPLGKAGEIQIKILLLIRFTNPLMKLWTNWVINAQCWVVYNWLVWHVFFHFFSKRFYTYANPIIKYFPRPVSFVKRFQQGFDRTRVYSKTRI